MNAWKGGRLLGMALMLFLASESLRSQTKPWVTAYFGGWNIYTMPASTIDFGGMTVCDHMSILPSSSGTFINAPPYMSQNYSAQLVSAAHAAGVKVTITMGAWSTASDFSVATNATNLPTFVANLVAFVKTRGYDGVDIDWEPFGVSDTTQWEALIIALRAALPSPYLITVTTGWYNPAVYSAYASIQNYVDQINIMTYDFSWASPGYNTWYAAPVYSWGTIPSNGQPNVSCDGLVKAMEAAGIQASKIGIGSEPGGQLWMGCTGPNQSISGVTVKGDVPLYASTGTPSVMSTYYNPAYYHWDSVAQCAYLSNPTQNWFLSYDDTTALAAKLAYVKSSGIGGIIIYEIGMSYNKSNGTNPFLDVTREFLGNGPPPPPVQDTIPPVIDIAAPQNGNTVSGSDVSVSASASDNSGIAYVTISIDGTQVAFLTSAPYTYQWNTTGYAEGNHTIRAVASDLAGNSASTSITVNVNNLPVDTTPPTVSITSPQPNSIVTGMVPVEAKASDNVGIKQVYFFVDHVNVSILGNPPYTYSWNTSAYSDGPHVLEVQAFDPSGNSDSALIDVTVKHDITPPVVSINSPSNNSSVSGKVSISALAADSTGISAVTFMINKKSVAVVSIQPYTYSWNTDSLINGKYLISVTAQDSAGNFATDSVSVVVSNHVPPSVIVENLAQGATLKGNVLFQANVSSLVGISSVVFALDTLQLGRITKAPFSLSWNSKSVSDGDYTLYVVASDSSGNLGTDSISVNIDNGSAGIISTGGVPTSFGLSQNYPNPFNPSTAIDYRLPAESHVELVVYDVLGREIANLVNGVESPGYYRVTFDASRLQSGVYIYRIVAVSLDAKSHFAQTRKLVLLK